MNVGFPIQHELNECREQLYKAYHDGDRPIVEKIAPFIGHKIVTPLSLIINPTLTGVGLAGMVTTTCTLGAFKVVVFVASLGNIEPQFPTGFTWFAKHTEHSFYHTFANTGEILFDAIDLFDLGKRTIHYLGKQLHLETIVEKVITFIKDVSIFIDNRLSKGFEKAAEAEPEIHLGKRKTPFFLESLYNSAEKFRGDHSASAIFNHTIYSIVNIPLNAATCVVSTVATIALGTLFIGKALIYAGTNLNIGVPTGAGHSLNAAWATLANTVTDSGLVSINAVVTLYKTADAVGVVKAIATIGEILIRIPFILFS